jgi:AhpD family alkylhydroperoxidase
MTTPTTIETTPLQARMRNPVVVLPDALAALQELHASVGRTDLDGRLLELVNLRASQINGCGVCAVQHPQIARRLGETDERLFAVAAWRDAPFFSDGERAALALTEAVTRMADAADPVPDEVWAEAARHFDESQLAGLVVAIAQINVWNRVNVATRQVAGAAW